jgi:hypothetical protein
VDYFEDSTKIKITLLGIFIGANVLVAIIVGVRCFYFVQHNPPSVLENKFTNKLLI